VAARRLAGCAWLVAGMMPKAARKLDAVCKDLSASEGKSDRLFGFSEEV
jgi:hypothetical protein